jgi:hypothetical protein
MEKIFIYEDFGATLQFAGTLGFDEDAVLDEMYKEGDPSRSEPSISDALEEAALDCIIEKGYVINY